MKLWKIFMVGAVAALYRCFTAPTHHILWLIIGAFCCFLIGAIMYSFAYDKAKGLSTTADAFKIISVLTVICYFPTILLGGAALVWALLRIYN